MPILSALRRRLVTLRDAMDARLHPRRRARARERLRKLGPSTVLFICLGNVCRSPFAGRLLAAHGLGGVSVDSAGFIGPGRAPPEEAIAAAKALGLDHADHCSKIVTASMLAAADVVFVFDRGNVRRLRSAHGARLDRTFWIGDFDPEWAGKRAIIDPWGKAPEESDRTFARIARCVDEVAQLLGDTQPHHERVT
jgi:protein-tyrosine phosphatase